MIDYGSQNLSLTVLGLEPYNSIWKTMKGERRMDIVARLKELKTRKTLYLENFTLEELEIIKEEAPEEYAQLGHRPPIDDSNFYREEPLYREDFTEEELEMMERLAPVEYKHLQSREDGLTKEQMEYIKAQQKKADAAVADETSPYYEPDPDKRRTAARILMRVWEAEKAAKMRE